MTSRPIRLVTVNTTPERAKRVVGRVAEEIKDRYTIAHVANAEKIEDVQEILERELPDLLFTASMWTAEQVEEIVRIAKKTVPGIKTFSIPQGLHAEKGPDGVVDYIKENLPQILDMPKELGL